MPFNLDSFCPEVYSQIEIDAEGDFKICCLANYDKDFGMAVDDHGNVMNVMTHTIKEAMNSTTHKQHRCQLRNNEKPTRCRNCYDSEHATVNSIEEWAKVNILRGISKRQRVLWRTSKDIPEYVDIKRAEEITELDGTVQNPRVLNLDLRFGNLCNQKCVMCSPQHSNQWYEDWAAIVKDVNVFNKGEVKSYFLVKDKHGKYKLSGQEPWWETERWWNMFDEISNDLRYIYFTGGEPLVVPAMQECLDRLISKGYSEYIELRYDTNLSVINQKLIDKWKHFKKVWLCISMDDTYDRYNLIRFPGKYDKIRENINHLNENNIEINYISSCIGIATPYSVIRVSEVCRELGVDSNFRFLEGPKWLDIRYYHPDAKKEIIRNLENAMGPIDYNRWAKTEIELLKKYMDVYNIDYLNDFVRNMSILDERRGTDWRMALPDVYDLLKNYCPRVDVDVKNFESYEY
jgi:organic radical activating enzyme